MTPSEQTRVLEEQIEQWRTYLRRRQAIHSVDVAELEDHLREQVAGLVEAGLARDEAFLVAVKRMGDLDSLSREFAREHSERLWKQLVAAPESAASEGRIGARQDAIAAFSLAVVAALSIKIPMLLGIDPDYNQFFYLHNAPIFVLSCLTAYFAWKRQLQGAVTRVLAAVLIVTGILMNAYPFVREGSTEILTVLHVPMALWFVVGVAYAGTRWRQVTGRMDFIRFSGELFIYYVLIALGGGVFTAFTIMIFEAIGIKAEHFVQYWLIPSGASGAVIIGSWLVEAKQSVIENIAPVLSRIFSPLFAAMLVTFLATLLVTGRGVGIERGVLIGFDLLLALVLGLLLYSISARDPLAAPGPFDGVQVVVVIAALLADLVALSAIAARISEFGFSPNRVAALGENLILLVNLAWSAVLYVRFMRGRAKFADLERWQTGYLPVYAVWAGIVVVVFPVVFGFR